MKKLISVLAGLLLWTTPLMAETYSWVDENGTFNFTEDYSSVPKKYRDKVDKRGDMSAEPLAKESVLPPDRPNEVPPEASKKPATGTSQSPYGSFGGKSYDQWKQEFGEREAAMGAIKRRIDEMDGILKSSSQNGEQAKSLFSERNMAAAQFNDLRKQYDQFAEQARKAGIKVNIAQ